ncbi:S-adenosyl-L-methionine-dependent methyltransferase [Westerdykella ornata]|uniref:S-adenosyl-L-methionine-dependent methyltransferase n=1 Tax=Westerdykella ornata TaxID=318751 RepID=A0A6A6K030_WESOR|nr:S-adenosyl-L-methionine-dependent methyltransferase [Westerdykella ornata]KAF2281478.1 S-adenosyl-L-methionine-dependent methyltransferase [Westerdykella ornata]
MAFNRGPIPKQAAAFLAGKAKVTTYVSTGEKVTSQFAAHNLSLVPAIKPGSIIHDNASGSGTVTRLILASNPPADITIHATDIDQPFLDVLSADAAQHNWPVHVTSQKCEKTDFADAFFDYDFMNIGIIFASGAGLDGAREVYRTLKPGGFAVVNCWKRIGWMFPIMTVHKKFRGDAPFPAPPINWTDGQHLRKIMIETGFPEEKLKLESQDVVIELDEASGEYREWVEKSWAYLAGIGGWKPEDEEKWDEEVDMLAAVLKQAPTTKVEGGKVVLPASQWVAIAEK